ncbi:plasmepsin VIII-like isoform X2 [Hylaeus volcanicus]|uniref:plasmepsin VIII-like isoform X2 n=1 Tax=Hylaeus volcanicus TaxID=313075 RepID=UPI0023B7ED82|nr:plasmepsin VIII-like isoform X2 [Hylaeus volcanicus]
MITLWYLFICSFHFSTYVYAYRKIRQHEFSKSVLKSKSLKRFQTIDIQLTYTAEQYLGYIGVGSSQQIFKVLFDTGSVYTWVPSTLCESPGCLQHLRFHAKTPKHYPLSSRTTRLTFGSGALDFIKTRDKLCFIESICLKNQTFGLVTHEYDKIFSYVAFDGIVGLAQPGLASDSSESIIKSLLQFFSRKPIMTKDMNENTVTDNVTLNYYQNSNIYIHFHFLSLSKPTLSFIPVNELVDSYFRKIFWIGVNSNKHWIVPLQDILVDGVSLTTCQLYNGEACQVIFDTGTTDILGFQDDVRLLRDVVGLNKPCTTWDELKPITFRFLTQDEFSQPKELDITITPQQLLSHDPNPVLSTLDCNKGISAGSMFQNMDNVEVTSGSAPVHWILGTSFLKNIDFILDPSKRRIGIIPY